MAANENALTRPIFELGICSLHKNGVEFHQDCKANHGNHGNHRNHKGSLPALNGSNCFKLFKLF